MSPVHPRLAKRWPLRRCVDCALCVFQRVKSLGLRFHCARTGRPLGWKRTLRAGCKHWVAQRPAEFRSF